MTVVPKMMVEFVKTRFAAVDNHKYGWYGLLLTRCFPEF